MGLDRGAAVERPGGLSLRYRSARTSCSRGRPAKHYQCALLQADGEQHLELNANQGDGADLFGAVPGAALSGQSRPHSREWGGRDSGW